MKSNLITEINRIKEVMGISLINENKIIIKIIGTAGVKGAGKWGAKSTAKYVTKMLNEAVANTALIKELKSKNLIKGAEPRHQSELQFDIIFTPHYLCLYFLSFWSESHLPTKIS